MGGTWLVEYCISLTVLTACALIGASDVSTSEGTAMPLAEESTRWLHRCDGSLVSKYASNSSRIEEFQRRDETSHKVQIFPLQGFRELLYRHFSPYQCGIHVMGSKLSSRFFDE